jgi:alanine-synthesizing transaminase
MRTSLDRSPNALASALERARAGGAGILDLTVSNPTTAGIPYPREAILQALADPRLLTYEPLPFGLPGARRAIADLYAPTHDVDPERVVLTASTSEAYSLLFKLLCDPGDDVAVPQPSYPLFDHLAAFESVTLVPYHLAYDGAWHIDAKSLARAVGARTRAILVVSPNNPTGSYLKRSELALLASFGLPIICDEVFATYPVGIGGPHTTKDRVLGILEETSVLVFLLSGLSKLAALPQMKLGWMIVGGPDAEVKEALGRLELIADSFLSVGAPVQNALPALLASRAAATTAIAERTNRNLVRLDALVGADSTVTRLHVEGGWYATLRLPHLESVDWALALLEREAVYVHPGAFFGFADEVHVVLSLLTPEEVFAEGVRRLVSRVARMVEAR